MKTFIRLCLSFVLIFLLGFAFAAINGYHVAQPDGEFIKCANSTNGQVIYDGPMVGRPLFTIKPMDIVVNTGDGIMAMFTTGPFICVITATGAPIQSPPPEPKEGV